MKVAFLKTSPEEMVKTEVTGQLPPGYEKKRVGRAKRKQEANKITQKTDRIQTNKNRMRTAKINSKPSVESKRSLYYAQAKRDRKEIKINHKPGAEGKRSLDYAEAKRNCNEIKIRIEYPNRMRIRYKPGKTGYGENSDEIKIGYEQNQIKHE